MWGDKRRVKKKKISAEVIKFEQNGVGNKRTCVENLRWVYGFIFISLYILQSCIARWYADLIFFYLITTSCYAIFCVIFFDLKKHFYDSLKSDIK